MAKTAQKKARKAKSLPLVNSAKIGKAIDGWLNKTNKDDVAKHVQSSMHGNRAVKKQKAAPSVGKLNPTVANVPNQITPQDNIELKATIDTNKATEKVAKATEASSLTLEGLAETQEKMLKSINILAATMRDYIGVNGGKGTKADRDQMATMMKQFRQVTRRIDNLTGENTGPVNSPIMGDEENLKDVAKRWTSKGARTQRRIGYGQALLGPLAGPIIGAGTLIHDMIPGASAEAKEARGTRIGNLNPKGPKLAGSGNIKAGDLTQDELREYNEQWKEKEADRVEATRPRSTRTLDDHERDRAAAKERWLKGEPHPVQEKKPVAVPQPAKKEPPHQVVLPKELSNMTKVVAQSLTKKATKEATKWTPRPRGERTARAPISTTYTGAAVNRPKAVSNVGSAAWIPQRPDIARDAHDAKKSGLVKDPSEMGQGMFGKIAETAGEFWLGKKALGIGAKALGWGKKLLGFGGAAAAGTAATGTAAAIGTGEAVAGGAAATGLAAKAFGVGKGVGSVLSRASNWMGGAKGALLTAGIGAAGNFGIGKALTAAGMHDHETPVTQDEDKQDDRNWDRMGWTHRAESMMARTIEGAGGLFMQGNLKTAATRKRIQKETEYLDGLEKAHQEQKGKPSSIMGMLFGNKPTGEGMTVKQKEQLQVNFSGDEKAALLAPPVEGAGPVKIQGRLLSRESPEFKEFQQAAKLQEKQGVPMGEKAKDSVSSNFTGKGGEFGGKGATGDFGAVAAKFESGGNAATISTGAGDRGGKSYGKFQLASKTGDVDKFLQKSGYGDQFKGMTVGSKEFDDKWKSLAKNDPAFSQAQSEHAKSTHYNPQMEKLAKAGIDLSGKGRSVQEAIMSTANQYGANTSTVQKALSGKDVSKMSDSEIVNAIQDYKAANVATNFKSSSADVQAGVRKRIEQERAELQKYDGAESPTMVAKSDKAAPAMVAAADKTNLPKIPDVTAKVEPKQPAVPPMGELARASVPSGNKESSGNKPEWHTAKVAFNENAVQLGKAKLPDIKPATSQAMPRPASSMGMALSAGAKQVAQSKDTMQMAMAKSAPVVNNINNSGGGTIVPQSAPGNSADPRAVSPLDRYQDKISSFIT